MPTAGTARPNPPPDRGSGSDGRGGALVAEKATLRSAMKAARAIAAAAATDAPARVTASALALARARGANVVSGYWAIGDELDVRPALEVLRQAGRIVALPVMAARGKPLAFRQWAEGAALEERMWGIREPAADALEVVPDLLLVPLLAFDREGGRLGYGGGFYDRTLAALRAARPSTYACGVCFAAQEVARVPCASYDERLDAVMTEEGLLTFDSEAGAGSGGET